MNTQYRELALTRIRSAIRQVEAIRPLVHRSVKGQIVEVIARELLQPLVPPEIGIGNGFVISAYEQESTQQDIILYDKRVVPPFVFQREAPGLFPLEAVGATIEVKTKLTLGELRKSHDAARRMMALQFLPPADPARVPEHVIPCTLAFESALGKARALHKHYDAMRGVEEPALRQICAVGQGSCFLSEGVWHDQPSGLEGEELLHFFGCRAEYTSSRHLIPEAT